MKRSFLFSLTVLLTGVLLCGCTGKPDVSEKMRILRGEGFENTMEPTKITSVCKGWKPAENGNPISPDIFCADPTAVEYEGRLYVYGTNDHQQLTEGKTGSNTYEAIKSLVMFSTADMVNWTYHGTIDVGSTAPWILSSWAPSVVARQEADGLTHFYLYFSNNGTGVGVITATDPLGPWSDPLGRPLIHAGMQGLYGVPNPFDPGVCLDAKGRGWLTFGGGRAPDGTDAMPHTARIVQLGEDMLSFAGNFREIPAPYFYEASELNIIGDTFVYTYNSNWEPRTEWSIPDAAPPTRCAMCYMTTKTPLDPDSWVYRKDYFANPGDLGYPDSNHHTHLQKYCGLWFLMYHTLQRETGTGISGGYRSICVMPFEVDEETPALSDAKAADAGVPQLFPLDPYVTHPAHELVSSAGIRYLTDEAGLVTGIAAEEAGAWVSVRGADFGRFGAGGFAAEVQGSGTLEIRLDRIDSKPVGAIAFDTETPQQIAGELQKGIRSMHTVYLVLSDPDASLLNWRFV